MTYITTLLGIKKVPTDSETTVLIQWIKDKFGNSTLEQIKIAFELLVENKLDWDSRHFQNFSSLYFTNVMQSYYRFQLDMVIPEERQIEQPNEDQQNEIMRIGCVDSYNSFIETGKMLKDFRNVKYDFLKKLDMFPFTEKERQAILSEAEELHKTSVDPKEDEALVKGISEFMDKNDINNIQSTAKNIALKRYFEHIKEFGLDLEQLINEKLK